MLLFFQSILNFDKWPLIVIVPDCAHLIYPMEDTCSNVYPLGYHHHKISSRKLSEMFEDIQGVKVVVNDLLIWGEIDEQHNERLTQVLERAK